MIFTEILESLVAVGKTLAIVGLVGAIITCHVPMGLIITGIAIGMPCDCLLTILGILQDKKNEKEC